MAGCQNSSNIQSRGFRSNQKEKLMNKLFRFIVIAAFIPPFLFSCSRQGIQWQPVGYPMLTPGEKLGQMVITTGVNHAFPLWSFCLPTVENDHLIVVDCGKLSFTELGI